MRWLLNRLGPTIIRDGQLALEELEGAVTCSIEKERYRLSRSVSFRAKRSEALKKLNLLNSKIAKNKKRQAAAFKRVRDENGKFQGGLLHRRPKIIFLIEKTRPLVRTGEVSAENPAPSSSESGSEASIAMVHRPLGPQGEAQPSHCLQVEVSSRSFGNREVMEKLVESPSPLAHQDERRGRFLHSSSDNFSSLNVALVPTSTHIRSARSLDLHHTEPHQDYTLFAED